MSELLPCPFCGGESTVGINKESTVREYFIGCMNCHIRLYKIGYKRFWSEAEAIAAWNTRADDYRHAAEYWQRMYEEAFAERTCRIEQRYGDWYCTGCSEMVGTCDTASELYIDGNAVETWNYCPNCGARVMSE